MVKLNKIYTRTGDTGTSGLVDGSRISKYDSRMQAIGDIDEANCTIGLAIQSMMDSAPNKMTSKMSGAISDNIADMRNIQNDLFDLGADVATPAAKNSDGSNDYRPSDMVLRIIEARVTWLETWIDAANADLEPLSSFILPGGSASSSALHLARAVTRRAERSMVAANDEHGLNPCALAYINRLSDLLFTLCRSMNDNGKHDILWVPGGSR